MKSKILKIAVLASAIAFINCGDETALAPYLNGGAQGVSSSSGDVESEISSSDVALPGSSANAETGSETSSSSGAVQQGSNTDAPASSSDESCLASSLPDACGPGTNPLPTSSSDAAVASSADAQSATSSANVQEPASSSSEAAKPASSSSEKKVESSSSETKVESSSSEAPKGIFLASGKEEEKDQMQVEYKTRTGWDGGGILSYPKQLSSTQKHGVVVWGPGGGTEPGAYEGMIRRLASHGFVVIALKESPGNASQAIKALDWLDKQNKDQNSPLFGKLVLNLNRLSSRTSACLRRSSTTVATGMVQVQRTWRRTVRLQFSSVKSAWKRITPRTTTTILA